MGEVELKKMLYAIMFQSLPTLAKSFFVCVSSLRTAGLFQNKDSMFRWTRLLNELDLLVEFKICSKYDVLTCVVVNIIFSLDIIGFFVFFNERQGASA